MILTSITMVLSSSINVSTEQTNYAHVDAFIVLTNAHIIMTRGSIARGGFFTGEKLT